MQDIQHAAELIKNADAILIGAGAGMGVDSGLPDFRGDEGFWKAYPPFKKLGLNFYDLADPIWFHRKPQQAWGFYGHRFNLYRQTEPHEGFSILKEWADRAKDGYFVFTSNVDGHFQAAGFDSERVLECHGAIDFLQCAEPCCNFIWPAGNLQLCVDESTFLAAAPLPSCPNCKAVARPNVLMFGDGNWIHDRTTEQENRYRKWLSSLPEKTRLVVIEIGAGTAVPTVRFESERRLRNLESSLIRINPRESNGPSGCIGIASPGLAAIRAIDILC